MSAFVLRSVCFLVLCTSYLAYGQNDSSTVYRKIEEFASKRRFTRFVYKAVFVEPKPTADANAAPAAQGEMVNPFLPYQDKIIRKIRVEVLDPFGHLITDTLLQPASGLERMGNKLHARTKKWVVNNKLLFKEQDRLDPLALSESERLLRQAAFSTDARILVLPVDSANVDVLVLVHDKWSITLPGEVTASNANVRLRDQNFFGLGYQFEQYVGYKDPGVFGFSGSYTLSNIDNTYISSSVAYQTDREGTSVGLAFNRPFFSPLAQWAGGLAAAHAQHFYSYADAQDATLKIVNVTNAGADVWMGRAFKILHDGKLLRQSHNLVVAGRYYTTQFFKRPEPSASIAPEFENSNAFVGNVGFALQKFYKDKYIYRFGANEDVPTGLIVQFLYGAQKREFIKLRYYTGVEVARALHLSFGYLTTTLAGGVFFSPSYTNDLTTNFRIYYFSNLLKQGGWYFRQFVNYNCIYGEHKLYNEKLTLTSGDLYGFNGSPLTGTTKMVLDMETVAYAPYNLAGFHIAPVLMAGYGMLGGPGHSVMKSNIYQAYSLGLMFRNENLLNSTFQVSFGLYPYFPNGNTYVLKYNPVTSFTVRVRIFAIGKPEFVSY